MKKCFGLPYPTRSFTHLPTIAMPENDINTWVERLLRYAALSDEALQPLHNNLPVPAFVAFYESGVIQWAQEEVTDPRVLFQPGGDDEVQETFYRTIDEICATFSTVRGGDWAACVGFHHSMPHC